MLTMSDILTVALIAGTFQILAWVVQKLLDKRLSNSQSKKNESEAQSIDIDSINSLRNSLDDLTQKYLKMNDEFIKNKERLVNLSLNDEHNNQEISFLKVQVTTLIKENIELKKKNLIFELDINNLQKENFNLQQESTALRLMIEIEKNEGNRLRMGIDKLIGQLRSVPLSPIWTPPSE